MIDLRRSELRFRLDRGGPLGVVWLALGSPAIAEAAARAAPDAIVIDMQHGLWERGTLEAAIGLTAPVPVLVRVADDSATAISTALDAGAEGVIVPLVESRRQARRAVRRARFPGAGVRSGGGVRPLADFPGYHRAAERRTVVAVMIETEKGLRNARRIASTPGVDLVFIGTGDLALSLGVFPAFDQRMLTACAEIHAACRKSWTPCGIFTPTAEMAGLRTGHGYRMVVVANDIDVVASGFRKAIEAFSVGKRTPPPPRADGSLPTLP